MSVELDPVRKLIVERVPNLKEMSLAIGKSHSYLQQFVRRGIPVELPERVRKRLADKLGVPKSIAHGKQYRPFRRCGSNAIETSQISSR